MEPQIQIAYGDAFSDSVNRNTFAYPTTITDEDGNNSYAQYHFVFGGVTRTEGPPPANQSQGLVQTMLYNSKGQLEKVTTVNNGAYRRFIYGPDYIITWATVNTVNDESYSVQFFDGLGRPNFRGSNHPNSTGGYKAQETQYDQMGRAVKVSNPVETNSSWSPTGDDTGWLYTTQTYNWQGKPLVTTNPDSTTREASYSGCGCAGGEVVTLTDEGTIDGGVAKRRQQKIYSDVLGRTVKTEILNWQGGSVYSATVNTYNTLDQVTQVRQYAGPEGSSTYQDTTIDYDGYGRLETRQLPEYSPNTKTTWTYNADHTINTITDPRGAVTTFGYSGTNRGLIKSITHTLNGSPTITSSFNYDAVGNRTLMTDGLGSQSYAYNQMSQLVSETRYFADLQSTGSGGNYTVGYEYNLMGQLKKITDPTNASVSYTFDNAGRVQAINGTNYGLSNPFISNLTYRAWGGKAQTSFGNGKTETVTYNAKMQVTQAQVPTIMGTNYQYYNDGRVSYSQDTVDGRFDRSYRYDHVQRITHAYSGAEAREEGNTTDRPFRGLYNYDALNHLTTKSSKHWSKSLPYFTSDTYTKNRRDNWTYDAAGNLLNNLNRQYTFDAAGRIKTVSESSLGLVYDGDGLRVKSTQLVGSKYYLRSSVMGGAVIEEVNSSGTKEQGFVYHGGNVLAEQASNGFLSLIYQDPVGASIRRTDTAGNIHQWNELDPWGVESEYSDPYLPLEEEAQYIGRGETGSLERSYGNMAYPVDGCTMDGIYMPCEMVSRAGGSGAAGVQADVYIRLRGVDTPLHFRGVVDASLAGMDYRSTGSQGAADAMNFYQEFQGTRSVEAGIHAAFNNKHYSAVDSPRRRTPLGRAFAHPQDPLPRPQPSPAPTPVPSTNKLSDCVKKFLSQFAHFDDVLDSVTYSRDGIPWYVPIVAKAFTLGDHIYFDPKEFDASNGVADEEMILLAHELRHSNQYRWHGKESFAVDYLWESAKAGLTGAYAGSTSLAFELSYYGNKYEQDADSSEAIVRNHIRRFGNPCR